jgi:hypothetical protein
MVEDSLQNRVNTLLLLLLSFAGKVAAKRNPGADVLPRKRHAACPDGDNIPTIND